MALSSKRPTKAEDVRKKLMKDMTDDQEKMVRLNVNLPESMRHAFKLRAAQERRTEADIVREMVANYLAQ